MQKYFLPFSIVAMSLLSLPAFSQAAKDTTELLGLPGDNLDLYAVLTLFQKSKTIEAFEKSLNDEKTGINNLDLNLDKKIDFIKVKTTKKDSSYTFVLQVDVSKTETQDVAVIYLNKEKGKVSIQMVGDDELYGKDYVVEPAGNSSVTANPGYSGADPVTKDVPATTTVVVQSAPIVQYVYSPAYVPYYPPYYYGYYPPYFAMATVIAVGIYRSNHWGYHGGYHGGHYGGGNTVIINNGSRNQINHYNNSRNTSNTVANNRAKGNYGSGSANRPGGGPSASTRPSTGGVGGGAGATRPSTGAVGGGATRPSTGGVGGGASASTRPSTGGVGGGASASTRPSTGASTRPSSSSSNRSGGGGGFSGGGGRSGGGGFGGGGGSRGGGGGGRRR